MKTLGTYQTALLAHVAALGEPECMAIYEQLAGQSTVNSRSLESSYGKSRFDSYSRTDAAQQDVKSGINMHNSAQVSTDPAAQRRAARAARIQANGQNSFK
jgi:hypothetical protein